MSLTLHKPHIRWVPGHGWRVVSLGKWMHTALVEKAHDWCTSKMRDLLTGGAK